MSKHFISLEVYPKKSICVCVYEYFSFNQKFMTNISLYNKQKNGVFQFLLQHYGFDCTNKLASKYTNWCSALIKSICGRNDCN